VSSVITSILRSNESFGILLVRDATCAATDHHSSCSTNISLPNPMWQYHHSPILLALENLAASGLVSTWPATSPPQAEKFFFGDGTFEATELLLTQGQVLIKSPVLSLYFNAQVSFPDSFTMVWTGLTRPGRLTPLRQELRHSSCFSCSLCCYWSQQSAASLTTSTCQTQCGNITIPCLVGIGQYGCFRPTFNLVGSQSSTRGPKLYLCDST